MDQRNSTGPFQPPPSCVSLCFGFTPKAPELSPDAYWKGCWGKARSQTPSRGFITKQQLPTPEYCMADTLRREKRSFYCKHQLRWGGGPGSHRASASNRETAPTTTESESTDKPTKAGIRRIWFPFLWGAPLMRNCLEPGRKSYGWHRLGYGSGALSPQVMPLETCTCAQMHRAPVPRSRAQWGAPGERPWSYFQAPRSTVPCQWVRLTWSSTESWERWAAEPGTHLGFLTCWTFLLLLSPHLFLSSFFSFLVGIPSPLPRPVFSFFSFHFPFPGGSLQTFPSHSMIR